MGNIDKDGTFCRLKKLEIRIFGYFFVALKSLFIFFCNFSFFCNFQPFLRSPKSSNNFLIVQISKVFCSKKIRCKIYILLYFFDSKR